MVEATGSPPAPRSWSRAHRRTMVVRARVLAGAVVGVGPLRRLTPPGTSARRGGTSGGDRLARRADVRVLRRRCVRAVRRDQRARRVEPGRQRCGHRRHRGVDVGGLGAAALIGRLGEAWFVRAGLPAVGAGHRDRRRRVDPRRPAVWFIHLGAALAGFGMGRRLLGPRPAGAAQRARGRGRLDDGVAAAHRQPRRRPRYRRGRRDRRRSASSLGGPPVKPWPWRWSCRRSSPPREPCCRAACPAVFPAADGQRSFDLASREAKCILAAGLEVHELDVVAEFGGHVDVAEPEPALHLAVLLPRLPAAVMISVASSKSGMRYPTWWNVAGAPGRIARAIEIDRAADRLDQLEVRRAGVDERDVDHPLLGGLSVDHDDAVRATTCTSCAVTVPSVCSK